MIHLVSGFRGTGKNTLVKMFNDKLTWNWSVYSHPNAFSFELMPIKGVAFADKLRQEVNFSLNLNDDKGKINNFEKNFDENYDKIKDKPLIGKQTYRDILIEHALMRRKEDKNYWVKALIKDHKMKFPSEQRFMITDWRYKNELQYFWKKGFPIITYRLFRSSVTVPNKDIVSEHDLDGMVTDHLLVPILNSEEEFKKACEIFPQYKQFKRKNIIRYLDDSKTLNEFLILNQDFDFNHKNEFLFF